MYTDDPNVVDVLIDLGYRWMPWPTSRGEVYYCWKPEAQVLSLWESEVNEE